MIQGSVGFSAHMTDIIRDISTKLGQVVTFNIMGYDLKNGENRFKYSLNFYDEFYPSFRSTAIE